MDFEVVHMEGSSASEVHDLCVCSTLYNTLPNMPSMSGEYHNEKTRSQGVAGPLAFHELHK